VNKQREPSVLRPDHQQQQQKKSQSAMNMPSLTTAASVRTFINDPSVPRPVISTSRSTSSSLTQQQQQQKQLEQLINSSLANDPLLQAQFAEETNKALTIHVMCNLRMLLKELDDTNWMFPK